MQGAPRTCGRRCEQEGCGGTPRRPRPRAAGASPRPSRGGGRCRRRRRSRVVLLPSSSCCCRCCSWRREALLAGSAVSIMKREVKREARSHLVPFKSIMRSIATQDKTDGSWTDAPWWSVIARPAAAALASWKDAKVAFLFFPLGPPRRSTFFKIDLCCDGTVGVSSVGLRTIDTACWCHAWTSTSSNASRMHLPQHRTSSQVGRGSKAGCWMPACIPRQSYTPMLPLNQSPIRTTTCHCSSSGVPATVPPSATRWCVDPKKRELAIAASKCFAICINSNSLVHCSFVMAACKHTWVDRSNSMDQPHHTTRTQLAASPVADDLLLFQTSSRSAIGLCPS